MSNKTRTRPRTGTYPRNNLDALQQLPNPLAGDTLRFYEEAEAFVRSASQ